MTQPCDMCPFRNDIRPFLLQARAKDIAESLLNDQSFPCHKTVDYSGEDAYVPPEAQHCAGAMIILEKMEHPNQMMRISERLGFYDRSKLNMDAPVFKTLIDFVKAQPKSSRDMIRSQFK